MDYLLELRRRLLYCLGFTAVVFCILSFYANPLYELLTKPLLHQLPATHLIATQISAPFLVPMKFAFIISLMLLMPLFFYHLWSFVAPALYVHERKKIWVLLLPSVVLFYIGFFFAYFVVLPIIFRFFVETTPAHVELLPDISLYLGFAMQILFAFGLIFEVPIVVLLLIHFKISSLEELKKARRYVIVLSFVVGMVLTPPDVLSQTLLAVPMWLLYELGLVLAKIFLGAKDATIVSKPE
ncbi:MAG: twin-arginine translocase subunit TatC [Gammaproteobacteria bacterium]|nr:twin-arginine translocase subunit TatC [Gammaproteobacteria bacterium]